MERSEEIVMTNDVTKFCVSWVTINVVSPAVESFVSSWNAHRIPGRDGGIPIVLAWTRNQATHLQRLSIPTVEDAISLHANAGGYLTPERCYGIDPIGGYPQLQLLRHRDFRQPYPCMGAVFQVVVTSDGELFKQAFHSFINLTCRYASLI